MHRLKSAASRIALPLAGAVLAGLPAMPAQAQAAGAVTATFGCDAPAGHNCAFTLVHRDGSAQAFGIRSGQRYNLRIVPDVDRYVVVVDHVPVQLDGCPQAQAQGAFCKAAIVQRGYNN